MSKNIVYALHGFLGQAADWNSIQNELKKMRTGHDVEFLAENLFAKDSSPILEFEDFEIELFKGDCLNIEAFKKHRVKFTSLDEPTIWFAVFY